MQRSLETSSTLRVNFIVSFLFTSTQYLSYVEPFPQREISNFVFVLKKKRSYTSTLIYNYNYPHFFSPLFPFTPKLIIIYSPNELFIPPPQMHKYINAYNGITLLWGGGGDGENFSYVY